MLNELLTETLRTRFPPRQRRAAWWRFRAVSAAGAATAQTGVIEDDYVGCLTDRYFDNHEITVKSPC